MKLRSALGKYVALIAVILILAISLAVSLRAVITQQQQEKRELSNIQWAVLNFEVDYFRLRNVLDLYVFSDAWPQRRDLEQRLDVLWSDIRLLLGGETARAIRALDGVHETVTAFEATLARLDPQIRGLDRTDLGAHHRIHETLARYEGPVHQMTLKANFARDTERAVSAEALRRPYLLLALSFAGILISGSLIIVLLAREVRKAQRAEADALESRRLAEHADRAKSDFLAHMSHELRTPLNAIIGFSNIIEAEMLGPMGNERYREYIKDIGMSGTHLLSLINDILDLSRIEAGRFELDEAEVNVAEIIRSSVNLLSHQADRGDIRLSQKVLPSLPPLFADTRALRQILLNLLSNAIRYTLEGGEVAVTAGLGADGRFEITITDTGIGMTEEEIEKAVEPFKQVENLLTRRYHGTGLGLPLAKYLVELHGGSLTLRSEPGLGTTVTATFPSWRVRDPSLAA